jgi:hypothetical protein
MSRNRDRGAQAIIMLLQADEASARSGFACLFSTSDEYETAIITERRAQGRYGRRLGHWPLVIFIGCALAMSGAAVLWH